MYTGLLVVSTSFIVRVYSIYIIIMRVRVRSGVYDHISDIYVYNIFYIGLQIYII